MFQSLMEKIAAIDIGSNAIRLSVARIEADGDFKLIKKVRVPLRLGSEAFGPSHSFSPELLNKAMQTFIDFKHILETQGVSRCRAIATSACRESINAQELFLVVEAQTGIHIEKISGDTEAKMLLSVLVKKLKFDERADYLLFDLGGGSLELSQIEHGTIAGSRSFDLGTVRLLNLIQTDHADKVDLVLQQYQKEILAYLDEAVLKSKHLVVVGTGGNFRRLQKLRNQLIKGKNNEVKPYELIYLYERLKKTPVRDLATQYDLSPDRAEVILPALRIMMTVCERLPVKTFLCPKLGLIEAIMHQMIIHP